MQISIFFFYCSFGTRIIIHIRSVCFGWCSFGRMADWTEIILKPSDVQILVICGVRGFCGPSVSIPKAEKNIAARCTPTLPQPALLIFINARSH